MDNGTNKKKKREALQAADRAANPEQCYCSWDERIVGEQIGTEEIGWPVYQPFYQVRKLVVEVHRCLRCTRQFLNIGPLA